MHEEQGAMRPSPALRCVKTLVCTVDLSVLPGKTPQDPPVQPGHYRNWQSKLLRGRTLPRRLRCQRAQLAASAQPSGLAHPAVTRYKKKPIRLQGRAGTLPRVPDSEVFAGGQPRSTSAGLWCL